MWNIKRIISKGDYNYALVPGHPNATINGYVLEVNHKDGNWLDNRVSNLEFMCPNCHSQYHS